MKNIISYKTDLFSLQLSDFSHNKQKEMHFNQRKAGAVLNYIIIILNAAVGLLYTPYMLRMMGQSEYGLYSLVASVIGYLTILDFGFGNAIIRYTSRYRANNETDKQYTLFGMSLVLYTIIGVVAALAGFLLYLNTENIFGGTMTGEELDKAKMMILILTLNLAITFPFSIYGSIITAYEDFVFQKVIQISRLILNTIIMVVLLHYGYKAVAMVIVQTVFNISTLLINLFYCKYKVHIKFVFGKFNWSFFKEMAVYSFWIFLNAIMDKVYWSTGQFVLGAVSGTIAVSIFAVGIHLQGMYMSFSTAISSVFLPRVSMMVAQGNDKKEISDLFIRTGRIQFLIMALIICGFIVFGKPFMIYWAGEEYNDSFIITVMFFLALFVPLIQNMGITILQARNEMKFRSVLYVVIAFFSLAGQIVLSKLYGAIGCAVSIATALVIGQGFIMNIYYQRYQGIDVKEFWLQIIKMAIAPTILTIFSVLVVNEVGFKSLVSMTIGIIIFTFLFLIILWLFSMSNYEKNLIIEPLKKIYTRK